MKEIAQVTWRFFFSPNAVHEAIRDAWKVNIPLDSVIDNLEKLSNVVVPLHSIPIGIITAPIGSSPLPPV